MKYYINDQNNIFVIKIINKQRYFQWIFFNGRLKPSCYCKDDYNYDNHHSIKRISKKQFDTFILKLL